MLLDRRPWSKEGALLLSAIEEGRAEGYVAAHTVTTLHYIAARARDARVAATAVTDLVRVVHVVPLGDADFQQALVLGVGDFEDAVQAAAALRIGADYLVTRDRDDFSGIPIPVRAPGEVLPLI